MTELACTGLAAQLPVQPVTSAMVDAARDRVARHDIWLSVAMPDQYHAVEALSRSAAPDEMHSPLTADLIAWFVDRNPCGHGFIVTASCSGSLVGYFLFYPWLLTDARDGTDRVGSFLFVRLYVAPAFRRRKIFAAMTAFGLDLVAQLGIGLAYTVPNQRSAPGFLKFGLQQPGLLPFWVRPVIPGWSRFRLGDRSASDVSVEVSGDFPDTWHPDATADLPGSTVLWSPRHAPILRWRYVERPEGGYEIRHVRRRGEVCGYLVTKRMRIKGLRTLVVCDAWFDGFDATAFRSALRDALRSGSRVDLAIAFGGEAAPGYRLALRKSGFFICPQRLQPQPVSIIACGVGEDPRRVKVPPTAHWHLTPLDWDVF
jgi:GNAT superfamily N-acetyltransferase